MIKRLFGSWMQRHVNDPYVKRAIKEGYRARSAYKLLEIHEKTGILKPGIRVIDLGSAPGGWSQVLSKKICSGKIISLDLLSMNPVPNCQFLKMDVRQEKTLAKIVELCPEGVQLIVSDLSPNHSGNTDLDCLEIIDLNNMVIDLAKKLILNGGSVVMKMLMGEFEQDHFVRNI